MGREKAYDNGVKYSDIDYINRTLKMHRQPFIDEVVSKEESESGTDKWY